MEFKRIIVPNFPNEVHGLWAVQYAGQSSSDFSKLLGRNGLWSQQQYLHQFFKEHATDLEDYQWKSKFPNGVRITDAQLQTVEFARKMSTELRTVAETTLAGGRPDFDQFFSNYNNNEIAVVEMGLSKKQFPPKGWLRLYALRICSTCYVITGGAIKLVQYMDDRTHLQSEDTKLKQVRTYLLDNRVEDYDGFKDFITNE